MACRRHWYLFTHEALPILSENDLHLRKVADRLSCYTRADSIQVTPVSRRRCTAVSQDFRRCSAASQNLRYCSAARDLRRRCSQLQEFHRGCSQLPQMQCHGYSIRPKNRAARHPRKTPPQDQILEITAPPKLRAVLLFQEFMVSLLLPSLSANYLQLSSFRRSQALSFLPSSTRLSLPPLNCDRSTWRYIMQPETALPASEISNVHSKDLATSGIIGILKKHPVDLICHREQQRARRNRRSPYVPRRAARILEALYGPLLWSTRNHPKSFKVFDRRN